MYETRLQGRRTVWRVWGEGPPVVLLHGGFGSWTHFLRLIPWLAGDRMILCPDLPGYGDSDMPISDDLAHAIPAAISDGLDMLVPQLAPGFAEIDVIGFSFGCSIAGLLCNRLADGANSPKPRGLVLYGPSALGIRAASIERTQRLGSGLSRAKREEIHAANLGLVMLSPDTRPDAATVRLQDINVRRARVRGKALSQSGVLRDALSSRPVRALAATWGGADAYLAGLHERYQEALSRDYPGSPILIQEGRGHWVQHEAPEETAIFTSQFLDSIPPRENEIAPASHHRVEPYP